MHPFDALVNEHTEAKEDPDLTSLYPWRAWCNLCDREADGLEDEGWTWRSDHVQGHIEAGDLKAAENGDTDE